MRNADEQLAKLAVRTGRYLKRDGRVMATAESCTGGWIAKVITDIAGSSEWFTEGFVTYSNPAKRERLGVPQRVLDGPGAVSEESARAMARGALRRSRADIAVAVTGIAGPGGAVPGKPVGTVWFAWAVKRGGTIRVFAKRHRFRGNRDAVRRSSVRVALSGVLAR